MLEMNRNSHCPACVFVFILMAVDSSLTNFFLYLFFAKKNNIIITIIIIIIFFFFLMCVRLFIFTISHLSHAHFYFYLKMHMNAIKSV